MNELIKNAIKAAPPAGTYVLALNPAAAVAICTVAVVAGAVIWRRGYPSRVELIHNCAT